MADVKTEDGDPIEELRAYFDTVSSLVFSYGALPSYQNIKEHICCSLDFLVCKVTAKKNLGKHVEEVLGEDSLRFQVLTDKLF